jgi:hypothetical protein
MAVAGLDTFNRRVAHKAEDRHVARRLSC